MKSRANIKSMGSISAVVMMAAAMIAAALVGCGNAGQGQAIVAEGSAENDGTDSTTDDGAENTASDSTAADGTEDTAGTDGISESGISGESAQDAQIDFAALREENPEIFAWLYIPGTEIDVPVLQSMQGDNYYETHNASGEEDADGAVYIELANVADMCDFNTVLHGGTGSGGTGPFGGLYQFADPDYFEGHEQLYLYLDGNVLTYEIFAAYERDNISLLREYDFTYYAGCQKFLDDLYGTRDLGMNLREGWDGLTPYQFLVTLTTQEDASDDKQMVVVAVLTADAAGTISRVVAE